MWTMCARKNANCAASLWTNVATPKICSLPTSVVATKTTNALSHTCSI